MSYYGVSVLITILVTSLVAFCLLYKAKELNLGMVISISIGSIILGFTFSPVFKTLMKLLSQYININPKIALIISLMAVLIIFLLFILIISFIIPICIPKKLASIDCCVMVDRVMSKIKSGDINIKDKLTQPSRKFVTKIQEIVKNVFNPINKLKKPVDTNQIIDTMGIEKNENIVSKKKNNNAPDEVAFANLIGFMEHAEDADYKAQVTSEDADIQITKANYSDYDNLAAVAYQEIVATQISNVETDEVNTEITVQGQIVEMSEDKTVEIDVIESKIPEDKTVGIDDIQSTVPESETVEIDVIENEMPEGETAEVQLLAEGVSVVESFINKAFECKYGDRKEEAIEYYIQALQHEPDNEMLFWIVLDICVLYKQLGLSELAKSILEGLVSKYGAAIKPEVKMEIMNHL